METVKQRTRYGLILRRRAGQCLVIDGPATVHFLMGRCQALIVQSSDHNPGLGHPAADGQAVSIQGPAIIVFIAGSIRLGVTAAAATKILRGELLQGAFVAEPLLAAFACRMPVGETPQIRMQSNLFRVTHLTRTVEDLLCQAGH